MLQQLKMFNVRQPLPLLMAAHEAFAEQPGGFDRILRAVSVISFRYNVICNMQTNEQERIYNDVASRISRGEADVKAALAGLQGIYPEDAHFKAAFTDKELRTTSSEAANREKNNTYKKWRVGSMSQFLAVCSVGSMSQSLGS